MKSGYYILDGHEPVPESDVLVWGRWFQKSADRIVAQTEVGEASVSTVFLGLDHNWSDGPPILFETMIFGGPLSDSQWRYGSWTEAEKGHAKAVRAAQNAIRKVSEAQTTLRETRRALLLEGEDLP